MELQLGSERDRFKAPAYTCMCLKAMLQAAIDNGSWENAALLIPTGDPLEKMEVGGDEDELEAIYSYRKSVKELKTKMVTAGGGASSSGVVEEGVGGDGEPPKGGGGWKGKKKT